MDSKVQKEIAGLASRILRTFFCDTDVEFLISTFASDIVWLGAGEKMRAEGSRAVAEVFRAGKKDLAPCRMFDERYVVRELAQGCYLRQGDSWIEPKSGTQMYFRVHQRVTFIFRRAQGMLQTAHIHNSVSFSGVADDELFPARAGQELYRELEQTLRDREQQIELMVSQLPGGMQMCRMDSGFTTIWISEGLCGLLGYSGPVEYAAATGNDARGYICEEDYPGVCEQTYAKLERSVTYSLEYRVRRRDGSVIWVADFGKRAVGPDGDEVIYCFISDITDRKSKELQIQKAAGETQRQAHFLSRLYDTIPCGILQFTTDADHAIVSMNPMVWQFYGFSSEADYRAHVENPFQLVLEEDMDRISGLVDGLALDGETVAYSRQGRRRDGSFVWISVIMARLLNIDGSEVFQAVFTDITEMHKLQLAQEQGRQLENRALRAAICAVYPLILSVNLTRDEFQCLIEGQGRSIGRDRGSYDALFAESLESLYPAYREDYEAAFSRAQIRERFARGEREIYMELRERGIDGNYHWLSIHMISVDNPCGGDLLAVELVKVLDEQRAEQARQEQLLRDALAAAKAASSAKSDFLSRMSHDIRTPMNAIVGMSAIGQLKLDDPARVRDCFHKIDASSRYLLSLINDILDMSKIETGKMNLTREQFDFAEMMAEVTSIIFPQAVERDLTFEIRHQEPLERCYVGDAFRLKQILLNLLSNSLKFTPANGRVEIDVREASRANGFASLCFTVSDTGIGMSEEYMTRIFQPFEQEGAGSARNKVGSGLGLSIVYNLVQLMGGSIDVHSERGKGSTFTVTVPFEVVCDDAEAEQRRKSRELLRGLEVLVVDDDADIGVQTAEILGEIGAHTVWVDSGVKAVVKVRERLEQGSSYDIALIDWRMPDMDGLETTRRIRALVGPETTIILISAYDWADIESEARQAGADSFLSKPLFRSTVYDAFSQLGLRPHPDTLVHAGCDLSKMRLLLVEDNELNLEIAQTLLEMNGVQVETAADGRQAVEKFSASETGWYHAVLMDIRMPVMDGLAATRAIRALARPDACSVPIIAMTANAFDEDRALAREAGMSGYLVKPLEVGAILEALGSTLDSEKRGAHGWQP